MVFYAFQSNCDESHFLCHVILRFLFSIPLFQNPVFSQIFAVFIANVAALSLVLLIFYI